MNDDKDDGSDKQFRKFIIQEEPHEHMKTKYSVTKIFKEFLNQKLKKDEDPEIK